MISGTASGFDLLCPERVIICKCIIEERVERPHGISLCYLMFLHLSSSMLSYAVTLLPAKDASVFVEAALQSR